MGSRRVFFGWSAVRSRGVAIILVAAGIALLPLAVAESAQAAECTDTWTGPAEGAWATVGNWSAGHAPTKTDVACLGSGKTAAVTSGTSQVAVVQGEGGLKLSGGTLEVMSIEESSVIGSLTIVGGFRGGPGVLNVSKTLKWSTTGGALVGTGTTVILPGAEGEIAVAGGEVALLSGGDLVNQGTLALSEGYIQQYVGSEIVNEGTFTANTQHSPAFFQGTGSPKIVNKGTFRKAAGSGLTRVDVRFQNEGTVSAEAGILGFRGGGVSSSSAVWTAKSGGGMKFETGTYQFEGGTIAGPFVVSSAGPAPIVTLDSVNAEAAEITDENSSISGELIFKGTVTVKALTIKSGLIGGTGTLRISQTLAWVGSGGAFKDTGTTVLLPGAKGEIAIPSGEVALLSLGRTLINQGSLTLSAGYIQQYVGAKIINEGTFTVNSEHSPAIYEGTGSPKIINTGTFQKTSGAGTSEIQPIFENAGFIREASGKFKFVHPVSVASSTATPNHKCAGDPVDCATGNFIETQSDFEIGGRGLGLDLVRTYSAQAAAASSLGIFGYGWANSFGDRLTSEEGGAKQTLTDATGRTTTFTKSGGVYITPSWSQDALTGSAEAGFTLTLPEQTKEKFDGSGRLESVTDRNGNETTLAYNGSGKLETISDPTGRKITLTYNAEGLVEKAKDPMGYEVKYAYEGKTLKSVTMPGEASPSWQFKYDGTRRMTSITDGRGGKTTNEYDGASRVISQTDPAERKTTWEYFPFHTKITNKATGAVTNDWFNSNNQPVSVTRGFGTAAATTESFGYTAAGLRASRTDGNGHTWSYGYDANGNRTSEVDPLENETKWAYNKTHDMISTTTPRGETTTIERDANGNIESVSRPGPEETTQTTTYAHDEHGQLEGVTDPLKRTWSYGYDSQGNRVSETDPAGDTETFGYDEDSRLTSIVAPRGNVEGAEASEYETTVERDAQGRPTKVTDPLGHATEYGYDANSNLSVLTNPRGHAIKFTYNADDEQTKVEKPNGGTLKTGYDGAGEMTSQTDGNEHTTAYVRNVLEQPVEVVDPLGRQIIAEFDAAGNLKSATDPTERTTSYTYDPANRLTKISYSSGKTPATEYGYDADGNLTSMVDGTGESSFVYDQLGRLSSSEDGHGDIVVYSYDLASDLTGISYPNGKGISRAFDSAGRLESITDWLGGTTSFTYDPDSDLEAITFPAGSGNVDEYSYDHADQLSEAKFMRGAEALASLTYSRDKVGAIESEIREGLPGPKELGYGYDENGRLTEAGEASFEYDAADNLTKGLGSTNTYDAASQLETGIGVSYSYDKLGRRTKATPSSGPAASYEYDQAGNLISVERPEEGEVPTINESLAYDGSGLIASKTSGVTTDYLTWDTSEGLPLLLDDGQNSYIYGPDGLPVEQISSEEKPTYLHHDQLGSTRLLTNASGEASATFSYGPYGALEGKTGVATTPLGFAGQYTDPETGLQYLRARFYDPATARFLTRDPLEAITREPYAYAFDSPLNLTDPSGRIAGAAAGCAIGEVVEPVGGCVPGAAAGAAASVAAAAAAGVIAGSLSSDEEILGNLTISKSIAAKLAAEANGDREAACEPSEMPNFEDSSQPPGPGWEWRGSGPPGSKEGAWHNPETGESLHPDLEHGGSIGPHYDYQPWRNGPKSRVYPDGRVIPKGS